MCIRILHLVYNFKSSFLAIIVGSEIEGGGHHVAQRRCGAKYTARNHEAGEVAIIAPNYVFSVRVQPPPLHVHERIGDGAQDVRGNLQACYRLTGQNDETEANESYSNASSRISSDKLVVETLCLRVDASIQPNFIHR
jgi:hypothetical protein